jgi:hypothetical protein
MTKLLPIIKKNWLIPTIFGILFVITFAIDSLENILSGFVRILISPSILVSDYLLIGGLAATLLNVSLTVILNLYLVKRIGLKMTGPIFACILTIAGFAFFGKNLFNAIPMYIGIYLYSRATKTEMKNYVLVLLLSSGIAPIVSYLMFGVGLKLYFGIPLGIIVGMLVGFILPAFNAHAIKFHQGYNLYNTGFSMGVISMMLTAMIQVFVPIQRQSAVNNAYHMPLLLATIMISLILIIVAFLVDKDVHMKYPLILKKSGRLITDFVAVAGREATMLNIGIMGLLSALLVVGLNIKINGPVMGAILTVVGFAAFGKHPLNSIPVVVGAILAVWLTPLEMGLGPILAIFFVTGLAPLSGEFGPIAGLIAGFVHLLITPLALSFQGGFDLYNNGFAAGFVAAVLSSLFMVIKPRTDEKPI